jgi:hypothetical protein
VLDTGVGTREEEGLVTCVAPPDAVGRTAVGASHLEDFAVTIGLSRVVAPDDDAISNAGAHGASSLVDEVTFALRLLTA